MILQKADLSADPQLDKINYQWAYDLVQQGIANTWFPHEIPLMEDLADWKKMTDEEKEAFELFLGFFNPGEFRVNQSITRGMLPFLGGAPEVVMYLTRQMWEEVNHSLSFEYIMQTFPIDRKRAFESHSHVPALKAKEDFLLEHIEALKNGDIDIESAEGIQTFVKNIVATNIITEGIWFYGGFLFALSFRQRNLLRNFGSLIAWVLRDESLHLKFGIHLILEILEEHPEIITDKFVDEVRGMIIKAVEMEEQYNRELIPNGIIGLNADYISRYIKYVADRRLEELGLEPEYGVSNPAKWMATASDTLELVNFFETVNTNYEVNAGGGKTSE